MDRIEVVVAHEERATPRVGDVFLKVDADRGRTDVEVEAMALAPVPTLRVLWHEPPVPALAALLGTVLARVGEPSTRVAGCPGRGGHRRAEAARRAAAVPGRPGDELAAELEVECRLPVANGVPPADPVARDREVAEAAPRPWTPVSTHGHPQVSHVFVAGDEVTGVRDWSEAARGAALGVLDVLRGWWSLRSPLSVRRPAEHGFAPHAPGCEVDVPKSRM
ncbi:aminoglycoside phosphotransferase family protein [Actinosynnema sp. NPDC053489]|uniref:aminoglycoside phosphotransferase family protein n=1 Tax=Actinosynnema sp. NPDC053489 TaxID=3363916 RepID=UPI0037CBAFF9